MLSSQEAAIQIMKIIHDNKLSVILVVDPHDMSKPFAAHVCKSISPQAIIACCEACHRRMDEIEKQTDKSNLN